MVAATKLLFLINEGGVRDCEWALFNIIELMGSPKFEHKRIAYVVAPLVMTGTDSALMNLLPNVFRKDLRGMDSPYTVAISLSCMSRMCSEDLAGILYKDLLPLYSCSKPIIRRRVCVVTYKVFIHCPDAISELLPYLCDRLKDSKTGV